MKRKTDVIIVGAGLAGLTCAIKCKDLGREFLLLEKSQRIGGRIGSIKEDGYIFDLGFQVYNTAYHYTNSIIDGWSGSEKECREGLLAVIADDWSLNASL